MRCSRRACSPSLRQFSLEPLHPWLRVPSQPITSLPGSLPANDLSSAWFVQTGGWPSTHEEGYLGLALRCAGLGKDHRHSRWIDLFFPFLFFFFFFRRGLVIIITRVLISRPFLGQGDGKESSRTGDQERKKEIKKVDTKDRKQDIESGWKSGRDPIRLVSTHFRPQLDSPMGERCASRLG